MASYGVWAVSYNFPLFVLARLMAGLFKGNVSLSTAIITDSTTEKGRSKGMALIGAAFSLGFLFGPSIGAGFSLLAKGEGFLTFQYPAIFALSMAILNVIIVVVFFKESLPQEQRVRSISYGGHLILYTYMQAIGSGLSNGLNLVNPVSLFKYDAVSSTEGISVYTL